jgi:hypothetical protein
MDGMLQTNFESSLIAFLPHILTKSDPFKSTGSGAGRIEEISGFSL